MGEERATPRATTAFTAEDETFKAPTRYSEQYSNIYFWRLALLRDAVIEAGKKKWSCSQTPRVLDIPLNKKAWIVGTVYREMKAKPNVIQDISSINHGKFPKHVDYYGSPEDTFFLEDNHGRAELTGSILFSRDIVTGCVIAVFGEKNSEGIVQVDDLCFAGIPPSPLPKKSASKGKVALVSGILLDEKVHELQRVSMLADYLSGSLGDSSAADISHLVIAGDSLTEPPTELIGSRITRPVTSGVAIDSLSRSLRSLVNVIPVHIMPGASDPAPLALPQPPLHKGLFVAHNKPLLMQNAITLETNPTKLVFDGRTFLGTSGQPVRDLMHYSQSPAIDLLHKTLLWRHMAPTAPDTLWTYPMEDGDPFIISSAPDVYFVGNMPEFATRKINDTRIICLPRFCDTGELVLVDLDTLNVEVVQLD